MRPTVLIQGRRVLWEKHSRSCVHRKGVDASCLHIAWVWSFQRGAGAHQWRLKQYNLHGLEEKTEAWKDLGHGDREKCWIKAPGVVVWPLAVGQSLVGGCRQPYAAHVHSKLDLHFMRLKQLRCPNAGIQSVHIPGSPLTPAYQSTYLGRGRSITDRSEV